MARNPARREAAPPAVPGGKTDAVIRAMLALLHVACPLLFFTNLTRNPYFTQIVLLNVGIALCGAVWAADAFRRGEWRLPRLPFGLPLAAFLGVALASSLLSWATHASIRPGLTFEMTRVWLFTLVNCVMVVFLPGLFTSPLGESPRRLSIWSDISMSLAWGALWFGFHEMKNPDPARLMWDPYGGFLWALAAVYAVLRTRRGEALSFFHLVFAVCLVAGGYGILQYWGRDIIWTSPVQPYGGRPVSSFGNPNFLSSYLMMATPLAVVFAVRASGAQRWGYGLVAAVAGLGVLSTLTRSTYVGLTVALLVTGAALYRRGDARSLRPALAAVAAFIALVLLFPSTPVSSVQSPLARFTEILEAARTGAAYGPWHQRLLIWSASWEMLKDHALLGRGWGTFELFYPFFQGKFLLVPLLGQWRTHANNAHNVLLELWSQTGIIGVGAALWLFATVVAAGWAVVRRETAGAARLATAALLGGVVGMAADNFFGNVSVFFAVPAFLFWWVIGALFTEGRSAPVASGRVSDAVGRPLLVVFAAFCVAASVYHVLRWNQERWYFQGFKQAKAGDTQSAIRSLERAIEWFPGDVNTNYELGNSLSRWARTLQQRGLADEARRADERALRAYRSAIGANPGYDEIYFNEGITLGQLGRLEEAADRIEMALFINPVLHEGYGSLGAIYLRLGQHEKAASVYRRGAETFPGDKDLWNNYGYALTQLKRHDEAFDAYRKAVIIDAGFERGWANLAASARVTGRRDPILAVPGLVEEIEKQLEARNFEAGLAAARKVTELLPTSADAFLSVGNLLFYLNRFDEAEKHILKALELNPSLAAAHANLGRMYAIRDQRDLARKHLAEAIRLNPSDADTRRALDVLR